MRRLRPWQTVRGRLLLLAVGFEVIMLSILVANSIRLLHGAMTSQMRSQAEQFYPVLTAALTAPLAQRDYATVQAVVSESRSRGGLDYIVVLDRSGRRVASSGWAADLPLPEPSREVTLFADKSDPHYDVVVPIEFQEHPLGTLHFGLNLSHIVAARRALFTQGIGIAAVEIALSTLIMLLLGYWLTRHLKTLTMASLEVAAGNLSPPPVPEGDDDVGRLGTAFNIMSRGIVERVKELTAAKESAEISEERLRSITDSALDAIIMMDPRGVVSYWNPAAEQILGYSAGDALGKDLHTLIVPERYHADFRAAFPRFLQTGQGKALGRTRDEFAVRKDGQEISVSVSLSAALLNGTWHAVGILRDITAQKRINLSLRKLSAAVEHSPVSIIITDRDGCIEYVNPKFSEVYGYTSDEVLGRNPRLLKGPEPVEDQYLRLWQTVLSGGGWYGEFHNRRKDGSLVWVMTSVSPIIDEGGNITHLVAVQDDIEEQKKLQAELAALAQMEKTARDQAEQASRAKSEFLASMSHEIRTPLNSILGMSDLLAKGNLDSEQAGYLSVIQSSCDMLQALIDNILDLSRIEAGMLQLDAARFNLPESVRQIMAMLTVKSSEKGVALTSSLEGVPDWLVGDSFRLRQVLINLLSNAIKFTESGGSVALRVEPLQSAEPAVQLRFSVTDTGIGIPSEKIGIIFDTFTQADSATTRSYGGSGLGLAISRRLVTLMGGEIGVESTPGRGSCFHFTARFIAPDEANEVRIPEESREKSQGRPLSILIVDDNKDNRTVLTAYFRRSRHSVDYAVNGMEGLDKIREGRYDLVLLDIQMPVMDGYTVARHVRQWERETGRPPLPLIALTANARAEDREKSLEAGCTSFLTKPIHRDALLKAVEECAG